MTVLMIEGALKVSVILLMAMTGVILLKPRSAALRHWVLAVAVACACVTPSLSTVLPSWPSTPLWHGSASMDVPRVSQPAVGASREPDFAASAANQAQFSLNAPPHSSRVSFRARDVAWVVWLIGSVASVFMLLAGLTRLWWLASRARIINSGPWWGVGEELCRVYGLSSPVRLLQSDHSTLLITWGWRRPKVLLPADASGWSGDRVYIVLAHEFAHIARGDWAVQLAAEGLRALYWFNPLSWIVSRRLRVESERACDDAVLARGIDAAQYATHLLALARALHPRQPWLPAPAMARSSSLEGRIRAMLNTTLNRRPVLWPARTATVAALLGLTLAVGGLRAQSQFYSLSGTVLDPTHRVLPGTRLVLTNATNRAKYEVLSDAMGRFQFVGLPPAAYALEARLPGFTPISENIEIAADTDRALQLRVGSLQETITVTNRTVTVSADPSAVQKREEAIRRFTAFAQREHARCAAGGAQAIVGGNILAPRKLLDVRPIYPESLKTAGIGGTVTMDAVIGTDGLVRDLRNIKGPHPDLDAAAAEAVRQWQFSTTLLNCEPIEVEMTVTTNFSVKP